MLYKKFLGYGRWHVFHKLRVYSLVHAYRDERQWNGVSCFRSRLEFFARSQGVILVTCHGSDNRVDMKHSVSLHCSKVANMIALYV